MLSPNQAFMSSLRPLGDCQAWQPGTAQAGTWISLERGWTVGFNEDQSQIWVRYDGVQVH